MTLGQLRLGERPTSCAVLPQSSAAHQTAIRNFASLGREAVGNRFLIEHLLLNICFFYLLPCWPKYLCSLQMVFFVARKTEPPPLSKLQLQPIRSPFNSTPTPHTTTHPHHPPTLPSTHCWVNCNYCQCI